jgi:hypothetical protein
MADLTITPANVKASAKAVRKTGTAGATITAGQVLYLDSATNKLKLADANGTGDQLSVAGIALNGASDGQPLNYVESDPALIIGAAVLAGVNYCLSDTPGGICTDDDKIAGDTMINLGPGTTTTTINLAPSKGGVIA